MSSSPTLPLSMAASTASPRGMGFNSLPPLPIVLTIFWFLKSLDLRTVGLELGNVPPEFGWDLVLFEPIMEQTVPRGVSEPSEAQTEPESVLESGEAQIGPAPVFF